ncbi:LysR family transcriptional regulator ArgP [Maridesulfovibrio zosterae]|uniref:LysR family transcriptional regulator ArgP n=1 Tax=Maridesulfovibrio zosterae TaxID=82171 RepID=UPI000410AE87|nr:LysR family transcriptional regulator ArgP [Maridesulfovibrio zosterae]
MLDNKFLEALTAVVDEGGFEKASVKLNLTQSAISQRIKNLEEQLGQVLIIRSSPPEPTVAGRKLIKHLKQVRLMEGELSDSLGLGNDNDFTSLPLAVNADSLAGWLLDAVGDFLRENRILLDIYVDDENQTHELLRRGDVVGCISTGAKPLKGCHSEYLATIDYLCVCTSGFYKKWFPNGFDLESARKAPAALFNRRDETHGKMLEIMFSGEVVVHPVFYIPSYGPFADIIRREHAYGMVPQYQVCDDIETGKLIEFLPQGRVEVPLYWQSWDMEIPLLAGLRRVLVQYFENMS